MTDHSDDKSKPGLSVERRRKHPRHERTVFLWFQTLDEPSGNGAHEGLCYSVDVSQGGIGMTVGRSIPEGTLLMVEAVVGTHAVPAVCRCIHCRKDASGLFKVGLEFVAVPPDARRVLGAHFA